MPLMMCRKKVPKDVINKALLRNQSQTVGLAQILHVKVNARVMLTANVDISDRLINGQIGTVMHVRLSSSNNVIKIYIKFDDVEAGLKKISTDHFARQNMWVPIEKAETNIVFKNKQG